jgi:hypothetical protein
MTGIAGRFKSRRSFVMEKRAHPRHRLNTSVVCTYLSAGRCAKTFDGRMKNCCTNGVGIELKTQFKAGTVLVVRAIGGSCGYSRDDGFLSMALAEVKWSQQKSVAGEGCYTTGLKYVFP